MTRKPGLHSARGLLPISLGARRRGVFLVGFMGSGKSSVGPALARRLGWRFQDLDTRVEARERRSIAEIFLHSGEAAFRRAERAALIELLDELPSSPTVAALGGGAIVQADNLVLLQQCGVPAVFLDAPVEELWQRCQAEKAERPLLGSADQFRQLYEARRPLYMKAGRRVDTSGKDVVTVAAEVARKLRVHSRRKER
jgi:shikimate kinase